MIFLEEFSIKSHFYNVGNGLLKRNHVDLALNAFKCAAETKGCVSCMEHYCVSVISRRKRMIPSLLIFVLEGAVRSSLICKGVLVSSLFLEETIQVVLPGALADYRINKRKGGITIPEMRKDAKNKLENSCYECEKEETIEKTFKKC